MIDNGIKEIANRIHGQYESYNGKLRKLNKESRRRIIEENEDWNLYSLTTNQREMFIMQNPGMGKNELETVEEQRKLVEKWHNDKTSEENLRNAIRSMQGGLKNWLKDHEHFWRFFGILSKEGRLDFYGNIDNKEEYKNYIDDEKKGFLKEFYVTDLFKYRVSTSELGKALYGNNEEKKKFRRMIMEILEDEIEYVKPNIIFIFSTRTWETFYTYFNNDEKKIKLVGKEPKELKEMKERLKEMQARSSGKSKEWKKMKNKIDNFPKKVTKVHGVPFELTKFGHKIIVIPLCHFSPRGYNNLIQDSYFKYLKKGLEENREIINSVIQKGKREHAIMKGV